MQTIEDSPGPKAIVFKGATDKIFCAGLDLDYIKKHGLDGIK